VEVLERAVRGVRESAVVAMPGTRGAGEIRHLDSVGSAIDVRAIRGDGPGELTP
jgi:hypothetical protein